MEERAEPLACPFCGGKSKAWNEGDDVDPCWIVHCMEDYAANQYGKEPHEHWITGYKTRDEAVTTWNELAGLKHRD